MGAPTPIRVSRYLPTQGVRVPARLSCALAGGCCGLDGVRCQPAPRTPFCASRSESEHAAVPVPVVVPVAHRFRSLAVELGRRLVPRQVRDAPKNPRYSSGSRSSPGALTSRGSPVRSRHRPLCRRWEGETSEPTTCRAVCASTVPQARNVSACTCATECLPSPDENNARPRTLRASAKNREGPSVARRAALGY